MTRLWGGRFAAEPAPEMFAFTRSAGFDGRLAPYDCRVLAAHADGLAAAGVLTAAQSSSARKHLQALIEETAGNVPVRAEDEDVHSIVERLLAERDPELAARIRAGISRNDRVATAMRLWVADTSTGIASAIDGLQTTLEHRADDNIDVLMPGYTHLQRAQPVTLGLHLRAHATALARARSRFDAVANDALDACPLGAGALAGSTLPLDRDAAAAALGFARPATNPLDAVADRDFVVGFLAACALTGVACSRLGEEIVLWSSAEFGFARLDHAWATGSSLMPQKRNPDVAELARGKAGRLIGHLTGFLATLKSLPLAYNRDLQEDKEPAFDAADTLASMLPALSGVVATMDFDVARMREAAGDPALLATDLAEALVRAGVPFVDAHALVGRAALVAEERKTTLTGLDDGELASLHPEVPALVRSLDVVRSVEARRASHD